MSKREFHVGSFRHADKLVRGARISCCQCPAYLWVPMNTVKDSKPRDQGPKLVKIATRKFEGSRWLVGIDDAHDLCPKCRAAPKRPEPTPQPKPQPARLPPEEKPTMQTPVVTKAPSAPPPRAMGITEALTISAKLHEVYLGKDKGYADDWSDGKLAESLNIPRAWVKECRVTTFGDGLAGNDEIAALLKDAQTVRNDANYVLQNFRNAKDGIVKEIERALGPLTARLDKIDSRLAEAARAMQ